MDPVATAGAAPDATGAAVGGAVSLSGLTLPPLMEVNSGTVIPLPSRNCRSSTEDSGLVQGSSQEWPPSSQPNVWSPRPAIPQVRQQRPVTELKLSQFGKLLRLESGYNVEESQWHPPLPHLLSLSVSSAGCTVTMSPGRSRNLMSASPTCTPHLGE